MDQNQRKLKIGILLRNRHDVPGGLEKVLSIVARYLPQYDVEAYLYSFFPLNYDDFTADFQKVRYLQYPQWLTRLSQSLPVTLGRFLQKIYVKKEGNKLFEQMKADRSSFNPRFLSAVCTELSSTFKV